MARAVPRLNMSQPSASTEDQSLWSSRATRGPKDFTLAIPIPQASPRANSRGEQGLWSSPAAKGGGKTPESRDDDESLQSSSGTLTPEDERSPRGKMKAFLSPREEAMVREGRIGASVAQAVSRSLNSGRLKLPVRRLIELDPEEKEEQVPWSSRATSGHPSPDNFTEDTLRERSPIREDQVDKESMMTLTSESGLVPRSRLSTIFSSGDGAQEDESEASTAQAGSRGLGEQSSLWTSRASWGYPSRLYQIADEAAGPTGVEREVTMKRRDACQACRVEGLHRACAHGHEQCVLALVEDGKDVNAFDTGGMTSLMYACAEGNNQCARALLNAKAHVSTTTRSGYDALMFACKRGHDQCAHILIEAKAVLEPQTSLGTTALILACQGGTNQCVLALIKAHADVNRTGEGNWTPLMYSCRKGLSQCTHAMIFAKVDVDRVNAKGLCALSYACQGGHAECARALLNAEAAVNVQDGEGWSSLMFAAAEGHDICAQALIKHSASVDAQNPQGMTGLMLACCNGHDLCVQALIRASASVDMQDEEQWTALMMASYWGHRRCTQALIRAGADVTQCAADGQDAVMLATKGHGTAKLLQAAVDADGDNKRPCCAIQ